MAEGEPGSSGRFDELLDRIDPHVTAEDLERGFVSIVDDAGERPDLVDDNDVREALKHALKSGGDIIGPLFWEDDIDSFTADGEEG